MSDNDDINFVLQLSKDDFDMIVTIMLHDACHDFDNDKSNAAFKEYFFSNKAASSASSRLGKISAGLGVPVPGGGGFMKGGMEGVGMEGVGPLVLDPPTTPDSPIIDLPSSPKTKLSHATRTISEKKQIEHLKISEAEILKEKLSEYGGRDEIYSGINLIESIKFLLKVKYSFILADEKDEADEKEDEEAEKYAIEIAKGISPINTEAAERFKYTHVRNLPSIENELDISITKKYQEGYDILPDDLAIAIIKILRKITSLVNRIIFSNKLYYYDEETYINSILIALQEMFEGFVSIGLAKLHSAQKALGMINKDFGSWSQGNTDQFLTLVTREIFNMIPNLKQDYIAFLIGIALEVEESKINLANQIVDEIVKTHGNPSEPQYTLEDIDFFLKIIDKLTPGSFDYNIFSQLLNIYNENKISFHENFDYKFFFKESIRIITNDFTKELEKSHLDVVLKGHANYNINYILNKNLLDMSIKTHVFPIFEPHEFAIASLQQTQSEEEAQAVQALLQIQLMDQPHLLLQQFQLQIQQQIQKIQQIQQQQQMQEQMGLIQQQVQQQEITPWEAVYGMLQIQMQIQKIQSEEAAHAMLEMQQPQPQQMQQQQQQMQQMNQPQQMQEAHEMLEIQQQMQHQQQQMQQQILQQILQIQQMPSDKVPGALEQMLSSFHHHHLQMSPDQSTRALQEMLSSIHQQIQKMEQVGQMTADQAANAILQIQTLLQMQQQMPQMQGFGGGGNIQTGGNAQAAITKFDELLRLIENDTIHSLHFEPLDGDGKRVLDSSDIEDDDGEHYKQFADDLLASTDTTDHSKGRHINSAIEKYLGIGEGVKPTLKQFNSIIKQCKTKKQEVTAHINNNLKGAYESGKAAHYMNDLGGFTFLELYEVINLLNGNVNNDPGLQTLFSSLYVLTPMIGTPTERVQGLTRPQNKKLDLMDNIKVRQEEEEDRVELPEITVNMFNMINEKIKIYEYYNKYLSKIIDFLNDQKIYYGSSPKNLTKAEKIERSLVFTEILNYYLPGFGEGIKARTEWKNLFQVLSGRPSGGALDNDLWRRLALNDQDFRNYLGSIRPSQYINNAIPSKCAEILHSLGFKVKCFTSVIDPMGTFGDCYPVPDPNIEGDINIQIRSDDDNYMIIRLSVDKTRNITLTGSVEIKMTGSGGTVNMNTGFVIHDFAKSKPLSIANTVKLLREHNPEHNAKQIVRKFLGDFLQGVEAIEKDLLYLSGDKPATVMYYLLYSLKATAGGKNLGTGGYVDKSGDNCRIYVNNPAQLQAKLGGGGLKDKKRVRRSRKRRTNRKKRTQRRKKTQMRNTNKRRSNRRKTNKRRTVRRKNSKRRSTRRKK